MLRRMTLCCLARSARAVTFVAVALPISIAFASATSADDEVPRSALFPADSGIDFVQRSGTPDQKYIVEVKSTGVALLDVDRDGRLDVFLTAGSTLDRHRAKKPGFGCRLYRNKGKLQFEDVTEAVGLSSPAGGPFGWACGAAAADIDGDGWDDLLVTTFGRDRLFLNRNGKLEEITDGAGIDDVGWSASAAFGDIDGDGDLDLYIARYLDFDVANPPTHGKGFSCLWKEFEVMCGPRGLPARRDGLYLNRGDGTFEDATKAWKIDAVDPQYGLGVVIADLVGDPRPDVFVANDSSPNHLWENKGDHFVEVGFISGIAFSEDGQDQAGMGVALADFDANGRWDVVVTNFADERNNLYLNQGDGMFFDEADLWRLGPAGQSALSWGVIAQDFDLDGVLDIYVANGHVYPQADRVPNVLGYAQADHLFFGSTAHRFSKSPTSGLATKVSRGAAYGDLDNDGDLDLVVSHLNDTPIVYENRSPDGRRSLTLRLKQAGKNREALGASVAVTAGKTTQHRLAHRNSSFQASNDPRVHFGLGSHEGPVTVTVTWPDGTREKFALDGTTREATLEAGRGKKNQTSPADQ